jgi:hydrogenase maturation protease
MKTLVLGLGNELLSDDGVGILAVRQLKQEYKGRADIVESSLSGLALLDFFIDYDRAIIVDAIQTGKHQPGEIIQLSPRDLDKVIAPSPHYSGLPEILALAKELNLSFPAEIIIYAMEVIDPHTIGGPLSQPVGARLGALVKTIKSQLGKWE